LIVLLSLVATVTPSQEQARRRISLPGGRIIQGSIFNARHTVVVQVFLVIFSYCLCRRDVRWVVAARRMLLVSTKFADP
jgi:hypothetical protein